MAIDSKRKGKAGGARVITYTTLVDENTGEVWLIEIYDKSEFSTIKTDVIKKMLKELGLQVRFLKENPASRDAGRILALNRLC